MLKKSLTVFSLALIVGMAVGWNRTKEPAPELRTTTSLATPRATPSHPVWKTDDFISFARDQMRITNQPGYNPLSRTLADWTDTEIMAALDASLTDPDVVLTAGSARYLDHHLLNEWMRRDFDSALAWFEKLESRSAKSRLAGTLANSWPADKADQGLAFLQTNRELFPARSGDSILENAFETACRSGPAAVEKLLKILRESDIDSPLEPWSFPADFDFATLARSREMEAIQNSKNAVVFFEQWLARDSQQAFDWTLQNRGAGSLWLLFRCSQDYEWIGNKFETLDAGQRHELTERMERADIIPSGSIADFLQGIHDPSALQEAHGMLARNILRGTVEDHVDRLEQIGDIPLRISLLENARPTEMSEADEVLLRQKLTDWKVSPAQIQSILSRYQP